VACISGSIFELSKDKSFDSLRRISGKFVSITLIQLPEAQNIKNVLTDLRCELNPKVSFQIINPNVVYGLEHLLRTIIISFESKKRDCIFVRNEDIDLLLRLSYSRQVSDAIRFAGYPKSGTGCLLLYSGDKNDLVIAKRSISRKFESGDDLDLEPNQTKKANISVKLGIDYTIFDDISFAKYLVERAALVVR
jgi:tRNA threonylcarbamoyladenosine modification (KEOPS) complex Cgi121 subunit